MIDTAIAIAVFAGLVIALLMVGVLVIAFIWIADDQLDGLIKKKLKKRFGGDE